MSLTFASSWHAAALADTPRALAKQPEKRIALVIGNSRYVSAPLRNPVNDARLMADSLRRAGFDVQLRENLSRAGMLNAVRDFGERIRGGAVGLFYYSGHGMQIKGHNYLIPVDADIHNEDEVESLGLDASLVLRKMDSARSPVNIVILDACRNNPFERSFRSATAGLAEMDAPKGTLIAFSTAPRSVALDGNGANSLYTSALASAVTASGMPIEQAFKQVRVVVSKATKDKQIPWESSSLTGDFYFVASGAPQRAASNPIRVASIPPASPATEPAVVGKSSKPKADSLIEARKELARMGVAWSQENFLEAVQQGDLLTIKLFLAGGINVMPPVADRPLPIRLGSNNKNVAEVMDLLVANGLDVNHVFSSGDRSFEIMSWAITDTNVALVKALIKHGVDLNKPIRSIGAFGRTEHLLPIDLLREKLRDGSSPALEEIQKLLVAHTRDRVSLIKQLGGEILVARQALQAEPSKPATS